MEPCLNPARADWQSASPFCTERLQIVACPQAEREMIVNANCVLRKSRVLVRVRMRDGGTEALKIIVWHLVRVSTQRRMSAKMADQPEGKIAGQRDRSRLRVHILFTVFTDPVARQRAGRVEEYIVVPVIARCTQSRGKMIML